MPRLLVVWLLATVAATSASCGAATHLPRGDRVAAAGATTISGYGLSIDLPDGWSGRIWRRDATPTDALLAKANRVLGSLRVNPDRSAWGGDTLRSAAPVVFFDGPAGWFTAETSLAAPGEAPIPIAWTGNRPFVDDPAESEFPDRTVRQLSPDAIVLTIVGPRPYSGEADFPHLPLPLTLSEGYFHGEGWEGQPAPNVSAYFLDAWIGDGVVNVTAWFGRNDPTPQMLRDANAALATLSVAR
jgi:hypothetical protein